MPEFFVSFEYEPTQWRHIRDSGGDKATFTAATTDDATGLAAIQEDQNGKYLAIDITSADLDVNQVQLQQSANNTNTGFNS